MLPEVIPILKFLVEIEPHTGTAVILEKVRALCKMKAGSQVGNDDAELFKWKVTIIKLVDGEVPVLFTEGLY